MLFFILFEERSDLFLILLDFFMKWKSRNRSEKKINNIRKESTSPAYQLEKSICFQIILHYLKF